MPISGYFDTVFGTSGDLTTVPDPVQGDGSVSFAQGYGIDYSTPVGSGGLNIERAKMNFLFNVVTAAIQQYQQHSTAPFITSTMNGGTAFSYSKYDRVLLGGVTYVSLQNSNTDTPPSSKWAIMLGAQTGSITAGNFASFADTNGTIQDSGISAAGLIPSGVMVPFAGASAPSGWFLCYGQQVSRTTYANLFSAIGTAWGPGDGTTTFNLPDMRGRSAFGKDDMGGSAANRITNGVSGITGTTLGAVGGDQNLEQHTHTATVTDPHHTHTATVTDGGHSHAIDEQGNTSIVGQATLSTLPGASGTPQGTSISTPSTHTATTGVTVANASVATGITVANANAGSGSSANMPPAGIANYIIKQ